jgi:hypothetical protein
MSKTLKILLIVLGSLALVAVIFFFVRGGSGGESQEPSTGLVTTRPSGQPIVAGSIDAPGDVSLGSDRTRELVALLSSVSSLNLSPDILNHPGYQILADISTELPPIFETGRNNPFLPIGSDGRASLISQAQDFTSSEGTFIRIDENGNPVEISTVDGVEVSGLSDDELILTGQDAIDAFSTSNNTEEPFDLSGN